MAGERSYRKATIREVAERAGVSVTTVSHVVSGQRAYAPETERKVREAIAELKYTPSYVARGLRQKATMTLGVCGFDPLRIPSPARRRFAEELWRGVSLEADASDYSLLYYCDRIRSGEVADPFLNGLIDGLLMIQLPNDRRPAEIAAAGLPVVVQFQGRDLPPGVGAAYLDEDEAACLALQCLWDLGHRRIAYLAGPVSDDGLWRAKEPPDPIALWRLEAFRAWATRAGVYSEERVAAADAWEPETVLPILQAWMRQPQPPTAVFCANDAIAIAVFEAACELGIELPTELSVVGIDDVAQASTVHPSLTTIPVPVEEIGRESVRALLRRMAGRPVEECRTKVPLPGLILRESVTKPKF